MQSELIEGKMELGKQPSFFKQTLINILDFMVLGSQEQPAAAGDMGTKDERALTPWQQARARRLVGPKAGGWCPSLHKVAGG